LNWKEKPYKFPHPKGLAFLTLFLFLLLMAGRVYGQTSIISRLISEDIPQDYDSSLWADAPTFTIVLAGQVISLPRLYRIGVSELRVKTLHNDDQMAFFLSWKDPKKDTGTVLDGETYFDAVALQFPAKVTGPADYPTFAMGELGKPVHIWHWKASGDTAEINAAGPKAIKYQKQSDIMAKGEWKDGEWQVILIKSIKNQNSEDTQFMANSFVPIAFAVWEGSNKEKGALSAITTWHYLKVDTPTGKSIFLYLFIGVIIAVAVEILLIRWAKRKVDYGPPHRS
jgi:complex iron-sulfur molybdoenzyme family reductase subunit gamma